MALTGVSIVLLLYLANVAEILPKSLKGGGFEVEFRDRVKVVQAGIGFQQDIDKLKEEIKALRAKIDPQEAPVIVSEGSSSAPDTLVPAASEPQDIASANSKLVQENQVATGKGSIWLGTWNQTERIWTSLSFEPTTGILGDPEKLGGEELRVTRDLNLRETYPTYDESYYRDVTALGVISDGMTVDVLTKPRLYARDGVEQVWAEVTATYKPYIGQE